MEPLTVEEVFGVVRSVRLGRGRSMARSYARLFATLLRAEGVIDRSIQVKSKRL